MHTKSFILVALASLGHARFGQEGLVQSKIQALSNFGSPGAAATLAGKTTSALLAGANACAKVCIYIISLFISVRAHTHNPRFHQLQLADEIVSTLGTDPAVIAGAAALVAAEKNFNPFAQSIPTICSDASLPATAELRGIVPLVDPAVGGAGIQNANSAKSLKTPFGDNGQSVADVTKTQGFSNFTAQAA